MSAVSVTPTLAPPADDIVVLDDRIDVLPDDPRPSRTTGRRRQRQLWAAAIIVLVAFLGAQGYQLWELRGAGQDLRTTGESLTVRRRSVGDAQERLLQRRQDLVSVDTDLDRLETGLAAATAELGARTTERDRLLTQLDELAAQLRGTRASLDATAVQLFGQVQQVGNLRACLDGVTRALTLVTFDDPDGALRNLDVVSERCASAGASIDLAGIS